jgi:hypothetical protein
MVGFAFSYDLFQTRRKHRADRGVFLGRQHTNLAKQIGIQLERYISLHIEHIIACSTILRARRSNVNDDQEIFFAPKKVISVVKSSHPA